MHRSRAGEPFGTAALQASQPLLQGDQIDGSAKEALVGIEMEVLPRLPQPCDPVRGCGRDGRLRRQGGGVLHGVFLHEAMKER